MAEVALVALTDRGGDVVFYEHGEFLGAMNVAILEKLDESLDGAASLGQVFKALSRAKTESAHARTLARALAILREHGTAVPAAEVRSLARSTAIVATFPA